eukprot:sb/3464655/
MEQKLVAGTIEILNDHLTRDPVDIVFSQKVVHHQIRQFLEEKGVLLLDRLSVFYAEDMATLAKTTLSPSMGVWDVGALEIFGVVKRGDKHFLSVCSSGTHFGTLLLQTKDMELYPILECRNKLNDGLWYVISPTSSVQVGIVTPSCEIGGGVGSKLSARDSDVYVTCGAQPDQSFGTVYHLSFDSFRLRRLEGEFSPRYEHAAALHNTQLVVFGGADTAGNRNDIQAIDTATGKLSEVVEEGKVCPVSPRTIHNTGHTEGRVWVWGGGENGADPVADTKLYSLNLADLPSRSSGQPVQWQKLEGGTRQPVARAAHSSTVHGKHVYMFGGFTGEQVLDDLWRLDTEVGLWVEVALSEPRPHPRLDQTICIARLPYSDTVAETAPTPTATTAPPTIQDITGLLHEAADSPQDGEIEVELPEISGYQDVLVLFGGMDTQGNIFNDMYAVNI